jgi:hypothetical protein
MPVNTIPVSDLKSATDPNLSYYPFKMAIGTARIQKDILNEFGCMCKTVIITNNDLNNGITVITVDPNSPPETIPPNTKGEQDQWTSYIDVTPNAVSGKGILELWLVKLSDAKISAKQKTVMMSTNGMMINV